MEPNNRKKTVVRSFRLDEDALGVLEDEASREHASVNTLENKLLWQYSEFTRFAKRFNSLQISHATFLLLLNSVPESELVKAASIAGRSAPAAYISSKYGQMTGENIKRFMRDLSIHANWFQYDLNSADGYRKIILTHEFGSNWSLFLLHYFLEAFSLTGTKVTSDISETTVIFQMYP